MRHVITPDQARAVGMPRSRYRRLRPIFDGVRALPEVPVTLPVLVEAARTFLPPDAVATGFTALRLHGAPVGTDLPLRFVTREHVRLRRSGVEARQVDHLPEHIGRVASVGAAFAAVCTQAPLLEAVTTGDRLIHGGFLHPRDARAIQPHCRAGAESPQETKLRLTLVLAGLPLAAGLGTCSAGIAVLLLVYGAMVLLAAWAFWRLARFARGPVVATAVLHLFVAVAAAKDAQVGWIASLVALAQVVCIVCVLLRLTTTAFARD